MSDVTRVWGLLGIGAIALFLVGLAPGCSDRGGGGARMLLEGAPIRVKNQKLEVELFDTDVWDPFQADKYKPKNKVETTDYISVIALKYGGDDYCDGEQPVQADSVTIEYGQQGTGTPKRKVTFEVGSDKKIVATFPGADGKNTKKLFFGDDPNDHIRLVMAQRHGGGHPFKCSAKPGDNLLVYLY
jgi:hypothetical protein